MDVRSELLARIAELTEQNRALKRALSERQRRRAAARVPELEKVLELLPVGIGIAYGADCARMSANAALRAMLGVAASANVSKSAKGGRRLPFRVYVNGEEARPQDLPMQKCAREGKPVYRSVCEIHRADGRILMLESVIQPWVSADGTPKGSIGAFFDVTGGSTEYERLRDALGRLHPFASVIPICASCRRIADVNDVWSTFETVLSRECGVRFTHGLCPDCYEGAMHEATSASES